jgi:hypothetical protein
MSFVDKHKIVRRGVLAWAAWLISATAMAYFEHIGEINASDAAVITGIIGILTVVIGFQKNDTDVG